MFHTCTSCFISRLEFMNWRCSPSALLSSHMSTVKHASTDSAQRSKCHCQNSDSNPQLGISTLSSSDGPSIPSLEAESTSGPPTKYLSHLERFASLADTTPYCPLRQSSVHVYMLCFMFPLANNPIDDQMKYS